MSGSLDYKLNDVGEPQQLASVIAPSDMQEGYTFDAHVNGQTFVAVVPAGGVVKGQAFFTPIGKYDGPTIRAPVGHWKDGPFNFFSLGILSPHLWCAFCCTQCAMGQVMQRLRLDWLGRQATEVQAKNTFKVCVILVVAYTVYSYFIDYLAPDFVYGNVEERPLWLGILSYLGAIIMTVWGVVALTNTRSFVRHKYAIPEDQRCLGLEDVCCAFWCSCCTVAQIARHTGEHETYRSVCCSATGMPTEAPAIV